MPKAKPLNRLELTRRKMQMKSELYHFDEVNEMIKETQHFDKCPSCGEMALVHEGGCEHCMQCGYDACGLH